MIDQKRIIYTIFSLLRICPTSGSLLKAFESEASTLDWQFWRNTAGFTWVFGFYFTVPDLSIFLFSPLERICINVLENEETNTNFCGFYHPEQGDPKYHGKDFFENMFIATAKNNVNVKKWHDLFREYWYFRGFNE